MESTQQTEKLSTKELFINIFSNAFFILEPKAYLQTSEKRRLAFCGNNLTLKLIEYCDNDSIDVRHLKRRGNRIVKNTKQLIDFRVTDKFFSVCILLAISLLFVAILMAKISLVIFIPIPLLPLFVRCYNIELASKEYSTILEIINNIAQKTEQASKWNFTNESSTNINILNILNVFVYGINATSKNSDNEGVETDFDNYVDVSDIGTESKKIEVNQNDLYRHQLLSLVKFIYDYTNVEIDTCLIKALNNTFIIYTDLSFSMKNITRFLAILDKKGLLKFKRGDQKTISNFIASNFRIFGKAIKVRSLYNSLNDSMSLSLTEIRKDTPTTITDVIDSCERE